MRQIWFGGIVGVLIGVSILSLSLKGQVQAEVFPRFGE